MCFAFETPVESPKGPRPIQDYVVGDPVLAASAANGGWAWAPHIVEFSSGTGGGGEQIMVFILFGEGGKLIVSVDQPLLLAGGKLQTANRLVPGRDSLTAADGSALAIEQVSIGTFTGGIHDIATGIGPASLDWDGSLDGHLLNCAGAICGDFILQIRHGDPRMARYLAPDAPAIGTPEYAAQPQAPDRVHGGQGEEW
jgi:hypothetical protein